MGMGIEAPVWRRLDLVAAAVVVRQRVAMQATAVAMAAKAGTVHHADVSGLLAAAQATDDEALRSAVKWFAVDFNCDFRDPAKVARLGTRLHDAVIAALRPVPRFRADIDG